MEHHHVRNEKTHYQGQFSIGLLNCQRVKIENVGLSFGGLHMAVVSTAVLKGRSTSKVRDHFIIWVWLKIIDTPNRWFPTEYNHSCGSFGTLILSHCHIPWSPKLLGILDVHLHQIGPIRDFQYLVDKSWRW